MSSSYVQEYKRRCLTQLVLCHIISSSNKMPKAVKESIEAAASSAGALSKEDAKSFMKRLYDEGRLFEECWS